MANTDYDNEPDHSKWQQKAKDDFAASKKTTVKELLYLFNGFTSEDVKVYWNMNKVEHY